MKQKQEQLEQKIGEKLAQQNGIIDLFDLFTQQYNDRCGRLQIGNFFSPNVWVEIFPNGMFQYTVLRARTKILKNSIIICEQATYFSSLQTPIQQQQEIEEIEEKILQKYEQLPDLLKQQLYLFKQGEFKRYQTPIFSYQSLSYSNWTENDIQDIVEENQIATGVFKYFDGLQWSYQPNCNLYFISNIGVLIAIKDIQADEKLSICPFNLMKTPLNGYHELCDRINSKINIDEQKIQKYKKIEQINISGKTVFYNQNMNKQEKYKILLEKEKEIQTNVEQEDYNKQFHYYFVCSSLYNGEYQLAYNLVRNILLHNQPSFIFDDESNKQFINQKKANLGDVVFIKLLDVLMLRLGKMEQQVDFYKDIYQFSYNWYGFGEALIYKLKLNVPQQLIKYKQYQQLE